MARSLSSLVDNLAERIHKIKLNTDMIIKNVKCMKLNTKIVSDILNTETSDLLKNTHFLTIIPISFFTCCEKLFSHMNIWIIDKNSMKYHYHRKKIFTVTLTWKILLMQITRMQTLFVKILKQNI